MINKETIKKPFWAMSAEETFASLKTSQEGLSEDEAEKRRLIFGTNSIREKARFTRIALFLNQFRSPLILILVAAAFITIALKEWVNAVVILAAVAVNTGLSFWQENKAETVLAALKTYIRTRARARRENQERQIDAEDLVPGDIIRVSQGDRIPADARLIFANNLEVDESTLTGESLPVGKNPATIHAGTTLGDRSSMIFGGTFVAGGFGDAIIVSTGSDTELGRIALLVAKETGEPTPLQVDISRFSVRVGLILGFFTLTLFGLGVFIGRGIFEMFLIAVAVAVSAVPEGLPVALTVILAVGVERLASRRGVVRKLLAAETLGSTSVILTDKTGTLTQAKMELTSVLPFGSEDTEAKKNLLFDAVVNTDVVIENPGEKAENWRIFGRAIDVALVKGAASFGININDALKGAKITDRMPFTSDNKFSAVILRMENRTRLLLLGAPEILLEKSKLFAKDKLLLREEIDRLAFAGERVLAVAAKDVGAGHEDILHGKKFIDLEFAGLLTFHDPLRPKVRESMRRIGEAGVKTIIVTGDHKGTAEAVARELGMIDGRGAVLTGDDLNYLKKEEIIARSEDTTVYARVTPEQKLMLVKLYQEMGEIVAVTGDGINDAPALKAADIGIAVGSGTDVAKGAADLVILDDNFETVVAAVEEGRRIINNIRKVVVYLLSNSFDELFLIGGALLLGLALPLNALQILFVNFFSDSFPAVAFAFEKGIDDLNHSQKDDRRSVFNRKVKFFVLIIGALTSFFLFLLYFWLVRRGLNEDSIRTFIFASFSSYTLLLAFSLRSLEKSIFSYNPFSNTYLTGGVLIGLILTSLAVYLPFLQNILKTVALPYPWIFGVLAVGTLNIFMVELGKLFFRKGILKI